MSIVTAARREGKLILLIGLDRQDIDHLIGGDVVHLEAKILTLPDLAVFAGETEADLEAAIVEMGKDE